MKKKNIILFIINITLLTTIVAQNDTSLYFDGINDYVEVPNTAMNSIGTNDFTIEAWIKGDESLQIAHPTILSNSSAFGNGCVIFFHDLWGGSQSKMLCIQYGSFNHMIINNGTYNGSLLDGTCHHIAITRQGNVISFYADGVLFGTKTTTVNLDISGPLPLWMGRYDNLNNEYKGLLSQVRIWNVARTETEISSNLNISIPGSTPNLLSYWELNEGSGQVIIDKTTNANGQLGSSLSTDINDPQRNTDFCINTSINIQEIKPEISLTISPNPNNGIFKVELKNKDAAVEIYDIVGKKVFSKNNINNKITIDITDQSSGIYFIKVLTKGRVISQKFIKD